MSADGQELAVTYKLHNLGTKPIRYLTPAMWTSFGTGGTLVGSGPSSGRANDEFFRPGETLKDEYLDQIVPLSADLREKMKLRGAMTAIVVLMVKNITFADGTTYNDNTTSNALLSYFQELSTKVERCENLEGTANKRSQGKP